jgi:hypothetical protein
MVVFVVIDELCRLASHVGRVRLVDTIGAAQRAADLDDYAVFIDGAMLTRLQIPAELCPCFVFV